MWDVSFGKAVINSHHISQGSIKLKQQQSEQFVWIVMCVKLILENLEVSCSKAHELTSIPLEWDIIIHKPHIIVTTANVKTIIKTLLHCIVKWFTLYFSTFSVRLLQSQSWRWVVYVPFNSQGHIFNGTYNFYHQRKGCFISFIKWHHPRPYLEAPKWWQSVFQYVLIHIMLVFLSSQP